MSRPRLLDLFCGAGGAGYGYHLAGFDVVGVDIAPQPRYPFEFHQADALTFPLDGFDAVHASPPCQAYSAARVLQPGSRHPDLVALTRERVQAWGGLYVIENVPGAPMTGALVLCGTEFDLSARCRDGRLRRLRRHRLFESNSFLMGAGGCAHGRTPALSVFGDGGGGQRGRASYMGHFDESRAAMGIDWMTRPELSQAIPPTYTRFIGEQLFAHLGAQAAA